MIFWSIAIAVTAIACAALFYAGAGRTVNAAGSESSDPNSHFRQLLAGVFPGFRNTDDFRFWHLTERIRMDIADDARPDNTDSNLVSQSPESPLYAGSERAPTFGNGRYSGMVVVERRIDNIRHDRRIHDTRRV